MVAAQTAVVVEVIVPAVRWSRSCIRGLLFLRPSLGLIEPFSVSGSYQSVKHLGLRQVRTSSDKTRH